MVATAPHLIVTSARAPVAVTLSQQLRDAGCRVTVTDSLHIPIGRFTAGVSFRRIPSASPSPWRHLAAIKQIADNQKTELIIPTCEDIFLLARYRNLLPCPVFAPSYHVLMQLHSKMAAMEMARAAKINAPDTRIVRSEQELQHAIDAIGKHYVIKPEFGRFGLDVYLPPISEQQLRCIRRQLASGWVVQQHLHGKPYCSWSLVDRGRLSHHVCYPVEIAVATSAVHFRAVDQQKLRAQLQQLVEHLSFTGVIGCDWIITERGDPYLIECNPRFTSGIHLFTNKEKLASAILSLQQGKEIGEEKTMVPPHGRENGCMGARILANKPLGSWRGPDSLWQHHDPLPFFAQVPALTEIMMRSLRLHMPMTKASCYDLCWDLSHERALPCVFS